MAVQVFPFIYTAIYVFLFTMYAFCEGVWLDVIDYLFFVSPAVVVVHLAYSKMLMLCKWHRIACSLPLIPQAADLVDTYLFHFGRWTWAVVSAAIIVTMVLFMLAIYKVFYGNSDG